MVGWWSEHRTSGDEDESFPHFAMSMSTLVFSILSVTHLVLPTSISLINSLQPGIHLTSRVSWIAIIVMKISFPLVSRFLNTLLGYMLKVATPWRIRAVAVSTFPHPTVYF